MIVASRMVVVIAGCLVALLVIALACWVMVRSGRKKRATLDREGDRNAMRMGTYVEPTEAAIRLRGKEPKS